MVGSHDAELQIQQLREALRLKEQQISYLQSSLNHPQLSVSSSPSTSDLPSPVSNEFELSSTMAGTSIPFEYPDTYSRRNSIPRSAGNGHGMVYRAAPQSTAPQVLMRPTPIVPSHTQGVKRQRTMSQQVPLTHRMDRTQSNLSTQSAGPFVCSGPITPPPKLIGSNSHPGNRGMWEATDRPDSAKYRHRPELTMPPVTESVLLDPETYFANLQQDDEATSTSYFSPVVPSNHQLRLDIPHFGISNASVCGSMTSGPSVDTPPMTRESSGFDNHSVGDAMHMMQLGSQQGTDLSHLDSPQYYQSISGNSSPRGKHPLPADDELSGVGSNLTPPGYSNSVSADGLLAPQDMSRSDSATSVSSTKSTSSLSERAKSTLQRQIRNPTPLKPKPSAEAKAEDAHQDAKRDGKAAIAKTKYVRPRQPKVFCRQCDEHKEGFRGEHELRRHREAKHPEAGYVKKWMCVDPTSRGLPINVPIVNPLEKCKACKSGKKYGAYYNAAAHLRRTHFKEKPSRAKNKNNGGNPPADAEKRGGNGGGDFPSMPELKNWMMEVVVHKDDTRGDDTDENDDDAPMEATTADMNGRFDINHAQFVTSSMMVTPGGHDTIMSTMDYPMSIPLNSVYQPISSAGFADYPPAAMNHPVMSHGYQLYSAPAQMSQFGNIVPGPEVMTGFGGHMSHAVGELQFEDMMYTQ
ncbi:hypothetical protein BX600DRAFT_443364 [Xylariales sp. PMI_506]|nr:hypothetical protein BX600DRAFT_443364 [Xylariales sp. PMI_506]